MISGNVILIDLSYIKLLKYVYICTLSVIVRKAIRTKRNLVSHVPKNSELINWNEDAEKTFTASKNVMAQTVLLRHPIPDAHLSSRVDAFRCRNRQYSYAVFLGNVTNL